MEDKKQELIIIYDDMCPACRLYAKVINFDNLESITYIDIRTNEKYQRLLKEKKVDINEGFVVVYKENYYHGADALNLLSLLSNNKGFTNKLLSLLFKSRKRSTRIYPVLVFLRLILLKILRIKPII